MKKSLVSLTAGLSLMVGATSLAQSTHDVVLIIEPVDGAPVPEFYFEPAGLFIQPGDTINFIAQSPHHTVTAYHPLQGKPLRVPEGVEPFSSPMIPIGSSWSYTFTVPGVYDVWCGPHESYGMVMRIVVGEASGPAMTQPDDFGPEGTYGASGTVLLDPALDANRIVEVGSVSWSEISPESKAGPGAPPAEAGHRH